VTLSPPVRVTTRTRTDETASPYVNASSNQQRATPVASTILGSVCFAGPNYTGIVESWMVTWGPPVPTFGCWMEQPRPGSNHPDASNILYRCCMLRCRKKNPNDAIQDGGSLASRSSFRPLPLTRRLDLPPRSTRSREPDGLQLLPCAWSLSAAPPNSQVLIDSLSSPNLSDRGMCWCLIGLNPRS